MVGQFPPSRRIPSGANEVTTSTHVYADSYTCTEFQLVDGLVLNMGVVVKKLYILKHGCFTHISNPAEQRLHVIITACIKQKKGASVAL